MGPQSHPDAAAIFAARLIKLHGLVAERENADMVHVRTSELCKALGKPQGATMEEVKAFVCRLLPILEEAGMSAACGCGFLALQLVPEEIRDRAFEEGRDLSSFTPDDIDDYLRARLSC